MTDKLTITYSSEIDARPEDVYAVLADYHTGHPAILPTPYFTDLTIEEGGHGAGTLVRVRMNVYGVRREFRQRVSEPEPGRVLVETDVETGLATTFTVEALDGGQRSRVTIESELALAPGLLGLIERLVNPSIVRRIYKQELALLADYVSKGPSAGFGD